jgi:Co/Zn/Cd efflux system component
VIFGKTLTALAAAAAIAAAAAVSVFAAAFALFAVIAPHLGPAGAAAIVAAVAALIVGVAGLLAAHKAEEKAQPPAPDGFAFAERAIEMIKDRPILTVGAGLAAGLIAFRNPALAAIVAKALFDSQKPPQR